MAGSDFTSFTRKPTCSYPAGLRAAWHRFQKDHCRWLPARAFQLAFTLAWLVFADVHVDVLFVQAIVFVASSAVEHAVMIVHKCGNSTCRLEFGLSLA